MMKFYFILLLFTSIYCHKSSYRIPKCPPGEEFHQCKKPEPNCDTNIPPVSCPYICRPGCSCIPGYARYGRRCILRESCPSASSIPMTVLIKCPLRQVYRECGREQYCGNQLKVTECSPGCICKTGYVRDGDECVLPSQCNLPVFNYFPIAQIIQDKHIHPKVHPYGTVKYTTPLKTEAPIWIRRETLTTAAVPSSALALISSSEEETSLIENLSLDSSRNDPLFEQETKLSLSVFDDSTSVKPFQQEESIAGQKTTFETETPSSEHEPSTTWTFNYSDFIKSQEEELGFTAVIDSQFVAVPVADGCGVNEEPSVCIGCERTCAMGNHTHSCPSICSLGCACKTGFSRDESNHCIPSSDCPPLKEETYIDENSLPFTTLDMDSVIMIAPFIECPVNQIYKQCADCDPLCEDGGASRDKSCLMSCRPGCGCLPGMVKFRDKCMALSACPVTDLKQPELRIQKKEEENDGTDICPLNQKMKRCVGCDATCDFPEKSTDCIEDCSGGCACKEGYLKDGDGNCILPSQCSLSRKKVEQPCPINQVYRECKLCDKYCDGMVRPCPRVCLPGCNCAPGLFRAGMDCVKRDACPV